MHTHIHTHTPPSLLLSLHRSLPFSRYACSCTLRRCVFMYIKIHVYTQYMPRCVCVCLCVCVLRPIFEFSILFCSVELSWVQFSSVRFIDELSSMCAMEFRSVNDVISTYITTLYWIGKSLFSHRLRTFILSSTRFRSFGCPQFIGIIAFSVYGFMCSLCMYACAPPVIYNTNYLHRNASQRDYYAIAVVAVAVVVAVCVHNIISTLLHSQFSHSANTFPSFAQHSAAQPCMFVCMLFNAHGPNKRQHSHYVHIAVQFIKENKEWKEEPIK